MDEQCIETKTANIFRTPLTTQRGVRQGDIFSHSLSIMINDSVVSLKINQMSNEYNTDNSYFNFTM